MTFAELRKEGQRIYKETAEAVAEKEKALQKIIGLKIYKESHLQIAKAETAQTISGLWDSSGFAFQCVVKEAVSEKKAALDKMLSEPPTTEQMNLLNAIQFDKGQPSEEEVEAIARSFADNYRASHAFQGILEKAGFDWRLPSTCDYASLKDALNRVERYLNDRAQELRNFTGWRNVHPWFRLFFGEGWEDTVYGPDAELLDGNGQTTPTTEPENDPAPDVEPEPAPENKLEAPALPRRRTIGGTVMPPWI